MAPVDDWGIYTTAAILHDSKPAHTPRRCLLSRTLPLSSEHRLKPPADGLVLVLVLSLPMTRNSLLRSQLKAHPQI